MYFNKGVRSAIRKIFSGITLLVLLVNMLAFNPSPASAKTDYSDPAPSLIVNRLNPDGSTTLVHEYLGEVAGSYEEGGKTYNYYTYPELDVLATINYYATIDAMPAGVGTKAKGVTISALVDDVNTKNLDANIKWQSGQKMVMYPMDASTLPYQGINYYNYDFVQGQARYYYPNLVEAYTQYRANGEDESYLTHALDNPVAVEPMFATEAFQERYTTDEMLKSEKEATYPFGTPGTADYREIKTPVELDSNESFRFCFGLTPEEAQDGLDGKYSSTNKFCRWAFRVDFGPVTGPSLKADTTDNIVGQEIVITYTDNEAWRNAITAITVGGTAIDNSHYTIASGSITFDSTVFTVAGSYEVVVAAADFMNAKVTQKIEGPITNIPVTGVSLDKTTDTISVGGTDQLVATVAPADAANQEVTWASDNTEVATVDQSGLVTAVALGSANITVTTADGGFTATCVVTVTPSGATYTVTADSAMTGGSLTINPTGGSAGTAVAVTVTPDSGKQLVADSLKYTADGGNTYTAITATGGVYRFTLPEANVVVTAQFEEIPWGSLNITSVLPGYNSGTVVISLGSPAGTGNSFVYTVGADEVSGLTTDSTVTNGTDFTSGATEISATVGQYVTIYEITSAKNVVNYESRQITAGDTSTTMVGDYLVAVSSTSGNTATIIKYSGSGGAVTIPRTVNVDGTDYTVTAIANGISAYTGAFYSAQTKLTSVTIPNSVTSIGNYAFYGCNKLTAVTIPNSVICIGSSAFVGCKLLTALTIPNSVMSIGNNAFQGCAKLTEVTIPNSVTSIGDSTFLTCTGLTAVTIPDSVTSIGYNAFAKCAKLTEVTIPDSVTSIGHYAFQNCTGLTEVRIPDGVTSIERYTFSGCTGITAVTIPDSVTSIGENAFDGCTGLTAVTIPDGVTSIGKYAFKGCKGLTTATLKSGVTMGSVYSGCSGLTSVTIESGVTEIPGYIFSGCKGLTEVTIPDSVTSIGDNAFATCTGLTAVTLKSGVIMGPSVYSGCSGLTSVTIESGVTEIPDTMFDNCAGLTEVMIPDSVTSIGKNAFSRCTGLTAVTIPDSVTSIRYRTFQNCTGLTAVTISDGVTSIEDEAFYGCSGLTAVTIPNSVTSIGDRAFQNCTGLTAVTLLNSVTGICAFTDCTGLTEITLSNSLTRLESRVFQGCTGLTAVTIPNGVTSIGDLAFNSCTGLTAVTLSDSVTSIEEHAFSNCNALTFIVIPASVTSIGSSAFAGYKDVTSIYFMGSKPTFGEYPFSSFSVVNYNIKYAGNISDPTSWAYFANDLSIANYTVESFCVLTLDPNYSGVTATSSNTAVSGSGLISVPAPTPTRADYTFNGWYKDAACTDDWDFGVDTVTGDLTLYANWSPNISDPIEPPALTADSIHNTVGESINLTFTENAAWQQAITSITVEGTTLNANQYNTTTAGSITIDSSVFATAKDYSIVIKATGYSDASVTQTMANLPTDEHPVYTLTPLPDSAYAVTTPGGITTMTVNSGISGITYFTVSISPIKAHAGQETVVFVHLRDGMQLELNAAKADFDMVQSAAAGFNVEAGDVVKVYMVDELTNDPGVNPEIFQ